VQKTHPARGGGKQSFEVTRTVGPERAAIKGRFARIASASSEEARVAGRGMKEGRYRPTTGDFSMREVLLGQPEVQVALYARAHLQEADSGVAQFIDPGNFALDF
jgi:hypothetical protein